MIFTLNSCVSNEITDASNGINTGDPFESTNREIFSIFPKASVLATSYIPPIPKVIFIMNLLRVNLILSVFNCKMAFAISSGAPAVSAKLLRFFLGKSGISLQPLATGLKR